MNCSTCTHFVLCESPCGGGTYHRKWWINIGDSLFSRFRWYRRRIGGEWLYLRVDQPVGPPQPPYWRERQPHHTIPTFITVMQAEYWWPAVKILNKWTDPDR